jgi:hypothetical protein
MNTINGCDGNGSCDDGSYSATGVRKNNLEVAKIFLPILYVIFRLQYRMDKYYLMSHVFLLNMYIQYRNRTRLAL